MLRPEPVEPGRHQAPRASVRPRRDAADPAVEGRASSGPARGAWSRISPAERSNRSASPDRRGRLSPFRDSKNSVPDTMVEIVRMMERPRSPNSSTRRSAEPFDGHLRRHPGFGEVHERRGRNPRPTRPASSTTALGLAEIERPRRGARWWRCAPGPSRSTLHGLAEVAQREAGTGPGSSPRRSQTSVPAPGTMVRDADRARCVRHPARASSRIAGVLVRRVGRVAVRVRSPRLPSATGPSSSGSVTRRRPDTPSDGQTHVLEQHLLAGQREANFRRPDLELDLRFLQTRAKSRMLATSSVLGAQRDQRPHPPRRRRPPPPCAVSTSRASRARAPRPRLPRSRRRTASSFSTAADVRSSSSRRSASSARITRRHGRRRWSRLAGWTRHAERRAEMKAIEAGLRQRRQGRRSPRARRGRSRSSSGTSRLMARVSRPEASSAVSVTYSSDELGGRDDPDARSARFAGGGSRPCRAAAARKSPQRPLADRDAPPSRRCRRRAVGDRARPTRRPATRRSGPRSRTTSIR